MIGALIAGLSAGAIHVLAGPDHLAAVAPLIEIGLHHEQQHQELMLTDIKHVLSCNPLFPAYDPQLERAEAQGDGDQTGQRGR